MSIVEFKNVAFSYGKEPIVLHNINLKIPKGLVYGFLGGNGQGKTTSIKLLLGLLKPKHGEIKVFNRPLHESFPEDYYRIGSLVENPSLYAHLNAYKNLFIWANYYNVSKSRIKTVLEFVGLKDVGNKRIMHYSTGMKQRLGLAIALLHDPELLILDEPTNGLDPEGIIELRLIINKLKDQGKTIMISSHILSEVEKIVDMVGIIKGGQLVFEGTLEELKTLKNQKSHLTIKVNDVTKASALFSMDKTKVVSENEISVEFNTEDEISQIITLLNTHKIKVYSVVNGENNLEDLFLSITRN